MDCFKLFIFIYFQCIPGRKLFAVKFLAYFLNIYVNDT